MRWLAIVAASAFIGCAALPSLDFTIDKGINVNICWDQDPRIPMSGAIGGLANGLVRCDEGESGEEDAPQG